jgi:DNA-directed RNA polymerase specialized sigma24 family protein
MDFSDEGSVTKAFRSLSEGNADAMQQLWERYFALLVALARRRLQDRRHAHFADEEDVALSALLSFHRRARRGDFPNIRDRDDLWVRLVGLTMQKVIDLKRMHGAAKRGAGLVVQNLELDELVSQDPEPEFIVSWTEDLQQRLEALGDETLREVAVMRMGCHTIEEIAQRFGRSQSWVHRRLREIRKIWDIPEPDSRNQAS